MSDFKTDDRSRRLKISILLGCALILVGIMLGYGLGACSPNVFTSYTVFRDYDFEELELPLPNEGKLVLELETTGHDYSGTTGQGEDLAIHKGPYDLMVFISYARGTEGIVRVDEMRLVQEKYDKQWSNTDLPDKPLEYHKVARLGSYAPYIAFDDVDLEYDEVRFVLKGRVEIEGREPVELSIDRVIRTDFREYKYNDLLRAIRSV
jgi:hypothetical protein